MTQDGVVDALAVVVGEDRQRLVTALAESGDPVLAELGRALLCHLPQLAEMWVADAVARARWYRDTVDLVFQLVRTDPDDATVVDVKRLAGDQREVPT